MTVFKPSQLTACSGVQCEQIHGRYAPIGIIASSKGP
jgi:hypothetical protein